MQGGLTLLPDAVPDGGLFDVAVLKTRTAGDWAKLAIRVLARVVARSRKSGPDVDVFKARRVEIRCATTQPVQFDGDVVDPADRLELEIDPSSLTLAVPDHHESRTPPARQDPE
jgi:diacylglycerol kinase (ATP)